jgi:hypothetical protein
VHFRTPLGEVRNKNCLSPASPDAWELTFDMVFVERNLEGELPLVVTTSHEDESVDEVAF